MKQSCNIIITALFILGIQVCCAFGPVVPLSFDLSGRVASRVDKTRWRSSSLWSSADDEDQSEAAATPVKKPMSRDEIQELLNTIPVFAVTEPEKENGLVLLKEKASNKEFAHFFFSPEAANAMYKPLRQSVQADTKWDVSQYPLGLIWFELLHPTASDDDDDDDDTDDSNVEYRLVPEPDARSAARGLLEEHAKQAGNFLGDVPSLFEGTSFNQIPIFMDQFLRIQDDQGTERFPLYFSYQDLMGTLQQASAVQGSQYEAALSVVDLQTLVAQMSSPAAAQNDYRNMLLVPPSPPTAQPPQKQSPASDNNGELSIDTLTTRQDWKD